MNEQLKNYINMVDGCMDSTLVEPEDNAAWLIVKHTLEESIDAALASPADALVAGDRVDAVLFERLFNEYMTVLSSAYCQCDLDEELAEQCMTAIQAQKDGHGTR